MRGCAEQHISCSTKSGDRSPLLCHELMNPFQKFESRTPHMTSTWPLTLSWLPLMTGWGNYY
eukprot:scaffold1663_cov171-Amphora_coffeaeformis.AAC.8